MLAELVLFAGFCLILWFLHDKYVTGKDLPPGPTRFPILGNIPQLAARSKQPPYIMLRNFCKEYGSIMTLKFGTIWQVVVDDPDDMRQILNAENFADRGENAFVQERSWGQQLGVLWGNGETWKELRRFSIRTLRDFGFGKQKGQEVVMEEELHELLNRLNDNLKKTGGEPVDMSQFFTVSVLNILWSMMAGVRFTHDDEKLQALVKRLGDVMKLITATGNILMAYPFLSKILPKLTGYGQVRLEVIAGMQQDFQNILDERRAQGHFKQDQRDFIDVFLLEIDRHSGNKSETVFTDRQFITTIIDLFVAGSETTANTLEFAIVIMILNPEVQRKVQEEIGRVVGFDRYPTATDRTSMPYTEATLLEVQRLANVVPMIMRAPNQDTKLKSFCIPKGTFTILNTYFGHLSPDIWENPQEFKPERFLDENQHIINSEKLLVFGTGKRVCLGEVLARATLFTYFTTMLQNYTFESSPSHPKPTIANPRFGITMAPQPYFASIKQRVF